MVTRILFPFLLVVLLTCSGNEQKSPSEPVQSSTQNMGNAESLKQDNSAFTRLHTSLAQTIYIPVYSHIYQLNQQKTFNLTATLSFRNIDLNRKLTLTKVLYYDSQGNIVKNYLDNPISINPLASTSFVVEENDLRGGVGANFIVSWESNDPVSPPVAEAVMISTSQQQGISFVSHGRVLENIEPQINSN